MSHQPPVDDARDAHLLAALRHAPDRDVRPPAQVTAAILGQAKQAVGSSLAGRAAWHDGLRAALHRLWQPAPMAAFGTLAMATLIGVMWGAQNVPDATPGLRPAPTATPSADASMASGTMAEAPLAKAVQPDAPAREAVLAPAPAPAPAETMPRNASLQRDARAKSIADAATAGAPAPAPAAARARSEIAATALGAASLASAAPLAPAAAEINAAMNVDAARVRWRLSAQRLAAHDSAQRDWWAALARATQGRWQPAAATAATGVEGPPLVLLIDGAPRGSLGFEPLALVWRDADGMAWRAPVASGTLRDWQETIARW